MSGSHKNSEWNNGSGFSFNRHVYIPVDGKVIKDWKLKMIFSAPVFDVETYVVNSEKVDDTTYIFTPMNSNPLNLNQDPWVFNFLAKSNVAGTDLTVIFCM